MKPRNYEEEQRLVAENLGNQIFGSIKGIYGSKLEFGTFKTAQIKGQGTGQNQSVIR